LSQCWSSFHTELEKVGKQHDQLATLIGKDMVTEMEAWVKEKDKQSRLVRIARLFRFALSFENPLLSFLLNQSYSVDEERQEIDP
jgi:hypothetical protein